MDQRCEQLLPEIVTHMPYAFVTLDRDWRSTLLNDKAVEALGKPRVDLLGRTLWDVFPRLPETWAAGELRRVMDERVPVTFEANALFSSEWNEIHAYPTEEGIALFYTDISERKEAERESLRIFSTMRVLLKAAEALTSHAELDETLPAFADALLGVVPHKRIAVALYDEQVKSVTILYSKGERAFPTGSVFSYEDISVPAREAMDEGRPRIIDYDRLSDEEAGAARRTGGRLSLVVPLVLAGRRVGLVFIDSPDERISVTDRDVDVVQGIAAQAAAAIDNARLFKAESEAREQAKQELETTTSLLDAARSLTGWTDLYEVARSLAETLVNTTSHSRALVDTWNEKRREVEVVAAEGKMVAPVGTVWPIDQLSSAARAAVFERRTKVWDLDELSEEERGVVLSPYRARYMLYVPLVQRDSVVGLVVLDTPGERLEFSEREIGLVEGVASQAAVAIENARLFRSTQESARLDEALNAVNASIHSTLKLEQVTQRVLDDGVRALGCDAGAIEMLEGDTLVVRYLHGFSARDIGRRLGEEEAPTASRVVRQREPLAIADMAADEKGNVGFVKEYVDEYGLKSVLAVPLLIKEGVIGSALFFTTKAVKSFTEAEIDFGRKFGATFGLAYENSRLYEAEREAARLNEALTVIDHSIHSTLAPGEVLRRVVPEAARALGCESAAMGTREGDRWVLRYEYNLREGLIGRSFADSQLPMARLAADTQQVVVVDDALHDPRVNPETRREFEARSFVVVPLIARDEIIGIIYFVYHSRIHWFTAAEADFAQRLSVSLGLAIANARMYESEHDIAETLQTALLALPARVPGVEFAHLYRSAAETVRVGGDFYDLFELEHERLGVTVGDISGHGIDAAVLTSLVKNTIRVQATERDKTPADVVTMADKMLFRSSPSEVFATVFFGVLDCRDGRLVYCNAGHTTGVCVRADGGVTKLGPNSPLIGAFGEAAYSDSSDHLNAGDLLFLYTDGLTEARRGAEFYGEERLLGLLEHERGGDPERTLRKVVNDVLSFADGRLSDDLAILALQRAEVAQK